MPRPGVPELLDTFLCKAISFMDMTTFDIVAHYHNVAITSLQSIKWA